MSPRGDAMPSMCCPGSETSMEHDDVERDFIQLSDSNNVMFYPLFYPFARKFAIVLIPKDVECRGF